MVRVSSGPMTKEWLIHDSEVFFEGNTLVHDFLGNIGIADVAEMPTFGGIAGDVGFPFGITKDEAVLR